MDIQTTLLTDFLLPFELDSAVADGPSAFCPGFLSEVGGVCAEVGGLKKGGPGGAGGDLVNGVGGDKGAILLLGGDKGETLLKGFPAFLHIKNIISKGKKALAITAHN